MIKMPAFDQHARERESPLKIVASYLAACLKESLDVVYSVLLSVSFASPF
jgi:hypothetical protein